MRLLPRIIVGALLSLGTPTWAQDHDQQPFGSVLSLGSRVRVRSSAVQGEPHGRVVGLDESVLNLATDDGVPVKIPLASIIRLETSLGRKRHTLKGAAIGAVAGLIIGLTTSVDPNNCGFDSPHFCSRGEAVGGGSVVGALLGAGIGALIKSEHWGVVTLSPTVPQVRQGNAALGLTVAVRF